MRMDEFLSIALSLDTLARTLCVAAILYFVYTVADIVCAMCADTAAGRRFALFIRCMVAICVFFVSFVPCYVINYIWHGLRGNLKRSTKSALRFAARW